MAWDATPQRVERFNVIRDALRDACPHWKLGTSYDGWLKAQHREAKQLIAAVTGKLRQHMRALGNHGRCGRWEAIAVDGSDAACPRTVANQQAMGDTGKPDGMPQLSMTMLFNLGLNMPWAVRVGPSTQSEREHLRDMLDELPSGSLLVADAGFIGYDLCREMIGRNQRFLLRVGGNAHLLTELGYACETAGQTVYLWPLEQQSRDQPPIKLRLIVVAAEGKQPVYLVTNVLDELELTDEEAREIYRLRWEIEVGYRTVKQTLDRDGAQSRTPSNCYLEMLWMVLGAWALMLMNVREIAAAGGDISKASPAQARNVVRRAVRNARPPRRRGSKRPTFRAALAACQIDDYHRKRPKASRNYPRKKRQTPPSPPKIKPSTPAQRQRAQQLTPLTIAT